MVPIQANWFLSLGGNRQLEDRLMGAMRNLEATLIPAGPRLPNSAGLWQGGDHKPGQQGAAQKASLVGWLWGNVAKKGMCCGGGGWTWQTQCPSQDCAVSGQGCFFFYLPLACLLSHQHKCAAALRARMIPLTRTAPLRPLTWPDFVGFLCLLFFCSCCSFRLHALALFWLQQQQLFTLFIYHVWRRCQEELGEGSCS